MELTLKQKKETFLKLFIAVILIVANFAFDIGRTGFSIPYGNVVGAILIFITYREIKDSKYASTLLAFTILMLVGLSLNSFLNKYFISDATKHINELVKSYDLENMTETDANNLLQSIGNYGSKLSFGVFLDILLTDVIDTMIFFYVVLITKEYSEKYNSTYSYNEITQYGKRAFIYSLIVSVLAIIITPLAFAGLKTVDVSNATASMNSFIYLMIVVSLLTPAIIVFAILELKNLIKALIAIYKSGRRIQDIPTTTYTTNE